MQLFLCISILILCCLVLVLSFRLWCYRRQTDYLIEELKEMVKANSNYRITIEYPISRMEKLVIALNCALQGYNKELSRLRRENRIYKESITGISHDIRTPLTSAKGYMQILEKNELPEKKRCEYIEIVSKRLQDLSDMLNQLFEYARVEAGEMQFQPEVFPAGNVFAEIVSSFYGDFVKAGCEPVVEISSAPCYIRTDKQAYVRIVENLIKNALVHGTGGCKMTLQQEEKFMVITVSNQTDTIEYKDIPYIFDRFYTTDQSRSRKTTGLGLSIVKRFTEQMGGIVNAGLSEEWFTVNVCIPIWEGENI